MGLDAEFVDGQWALKSPLRRCPDNRPIYTGCPECKMKLCLVCYASHDHRGGAVALTTGKRKEKEMSMLQQLRTLRIDAWDTEELVAVYTFGKAFIESYTENNLPVPDWVTENVKALKDDIALKRRGALEKALKDAKAKQTTLLSAEEKRAKVNAEIAELEAALAGTK